MTIVSDDGLKRVAFEDITIGEAFATDDDESSPFIKVGSLRTSEWGIAVNAISLQDGSYVDFNDDQLVIQIEAKVVYKYEKH